MLNVELPVCSSEPSRTHRSSFPEKRAVEFVYNNNRICFECLRVEIGIVEHHLVSICTRSLGFRRAEVCTQVIEGSLYRTTQIRTEMLLDFGGRGFGTAYIIVHENKCNIVPVLWLATRTSGSRFGE